MWPQENYYIGVAVWSIDRETTGVLCDKMALRVKKKCCKNVVRPAMTKTGLKNIKEVVDHENNNFTILPYTRDNQAN